MRTISTYRKSGRLFILRVIAILQQLSEFSAEIGIAATVMRLVLQDNSRHFDHTKCSPADRPPPLPG
jgi:hypothetical protein